MVKRMMRAALGKTGLAVSRLGFGCMRLPMDGSRVNRELSTPMLRRAVELGVNYFDTAVGYCNQDSQRALGEALVGIRDKVIISTKNPHFDKKNERGWWQNLENSLERLRTDRIDIYNFHGINWDLFPRHIDGPDGQLKWMQKAKDQGLIRHICFSFHGKAAEVKKLASTGVFDSVTLQYNLLDRSLEKTFSHISETCGMGIVVMGPVCAGRLGGASDEIRGLLPDARTTAEVALRFVLASPYVTVALSGMSTMAQLEENVATASNGSPLAASEKRKVVSTLNRFSKLAKLYCTGCNYCTPCPWGVNISSNFSALNTHKVYGLHEHASAGYEKLDAEKAVHCMACGRCLEKCPQKIAIIDQLRETVKTLDSSYGKVIARFVPTGTANEAPGPTERHLQIEGKLEFLNVSDEPVEVGADFKPADGLRIAQSHMKLPIEAFRRASCPIRVTAILPRDEDGFDVGHAIAWHGNRVAMTKGVVRLATAQHAKTMSSPADEVPVRVFRESQLMMGAADILRTHSLRCSFAWDDEGLRFCAAARDDRQAPSDPSRHQWVTDHVALWLDLRHGAGLGHPSFGDGVFQINFLSPGSDGRVVPVVARPEKGDSTKIVCKPANVPNGYGFNAFIPWDLLGLKEPSRHIGMDTGLISHETGGAVQAVMFWSCGKQKRRPDRFGHLFLVQG